jgi:hypothetical protein
MLGVDGLEVFGEGDGDFDIVGAKRVAAEGGVEDVIGVAQLGDRGGLRSRNAPSRASGTMS